MIVSLTLCDTHASRVKGPSTVSFEPGVNVLIGPNGSGKSTILTGIVRCKDCKKETQGSRDFSFFDMEKDNVRTKSEVHTAVDVFSRWISHGQMVRAMVERLPDSSIVIVDEPDMALDSEGIFTLRSVLMELGASGRQAIVSVHNPILWIGTRIVLGEDSSYPEKVVSAYRDSLK